MPQSRINTFFSAALNDSAYQAQVQRESEQHTADREEAKLAEEMQQARKRLRELSGKEEKRGPGRPRTRSLNIAVSNNSNSVINISLAGAESANLPSAVNTVAASSPATTFSSSSTSSSSLSSASPSLASSASNSSAASESPSPASPTTPPPSKKRRVDWLKGGVLFRMITAAVESHKSYRAAVAYLQGNEALGHTFALLTESTVRSWYEPHSFVLKQRVVERVDNNGCHKERSGSPSSLAAFPEVEVEVADILTSIRRSSGAVNSSVIKVGHQKRTATALHRHRSAAEHCLLSPCAGRLPQRQPGERAGLVGIAQVQPPLVPSVDAGQPGLDIQEVNHQRAEAAGGLAGAGRQHGDARYGCSGDAPD
jgi:hypothetical protein